MYYVMVLQSGSGTRQVTKKQTYNIHVPLKIVEARGQKLIYYQDFMVIRSSMPANSTGSTHSLRRKFKSYFRLRNASSVLWQAWNSEVLVDHL